ncbi:hypothetical protein HDU96_007460, partial [Phlyctochytrium bullatum]
GKIDPRVDVAAALQSGWKSFRACIQAAQADTRMIEQGLAWWDVQSWSATGAGHPGLSIADVMEGWVPAGLVKTLRGCGVPAGTARTAAVRIPRK